MLLKLFNTNLSECIKYFPGSIFKESKQLMDDDQKPQSGDFFLVDSQKCRKWKFDNRSYLKNQSKDTYVLGYRKLRIDKEQKIVCLYFKGKGRSQEDGDDFTPYTFKKRVYWLISNTRYIFIHYYDDRIGFNYI